MLIMFADTDCDITPEIAEKYGYKLISMPYSIDGITTYPYEDFKVFEPDPFYNMLRRGTIPSTSSVPQEKYIEYFEPYFAAGDDIMYVHFSKAMSATFNNMELAVKSLKEKYPERKFYAIDTKAITVLSMNILLEIGDLYKSGASAEDIIAFADREVDKFALYFFADDLRFFKRSGRVNGITATMGNMLGIRPIIYISQEGKMVSISKERGRQRAMERLVKYAEELGDDIKNHRVIIGHTGADETAHNVGKLLKEHFGDDLSIEYVNVNPTSGSHCGPDGVGVSFHAKHR